MKLTSALLGILAISFGPAAEAQAQYEYVTNNGTITITGYSGEPGDVTIPGTISNNGK